MAITIKCTYDYLGRRATKKVTVNGRITALELGIYELHKINLTECYKSKTKAINVSRKKYCPGNNSYGIPARPRIIDIKAN